METLDPSTGLPLPANAIQRILLISPKVHIYNIPPLASTRGYVAASWTDDPKRHIFTCRLRLIETATPLPPSKPNTSHTEDNDGEEEEQEQIKVDIVLEDPATGTLFAAAPYTTQAIVESALDSSRFFALRVQDPSGRKATLGMGFEERSDAFDFSVALQEARKSLGWEKGDKSLNPAEKGRSSSKKKAEFEGREEVKRDLSLKEGETITVSFGGNKGFGRRRGGGAETTQKEEVGGSLNSFALPPPPGGGGVKSAAGGSGSGSGGFGGVFGIPPPPKVEGGRREKAKEFGFDDGQFGEFA